MGKNMKTKLKDGRTAIINFLSKGDSARELQKHINSIIKEDVPIHLDKKVKLKEEKEWKKNELKKQKNKQGFLLVARVDGRIVGTSGANREMGRCRNNILIGIVVRKEYRGLGLGEKLLRENIKQSKKKLKAKKVYLWVYGGNNNAQRLYKKLGFVEIARLPKWIPYKGKNVDQIFMLLKN